MTWTRWIFLSLVLILGLPEGQAGKRRITFAPDVAEPFLKRPCRRRIPSSAPEEKAAESAPSDITSGVTSLVTATAPESSQVVEPVLEAPPERDARLEEVVPSSSPERASPTPIHLSFQTVEELETALMSAAEAQRFVGLKDNVFDQPNYTVGILEIGIVGFETMQLSQNEWKAACQRLKATQWTPGDYRQAVGGHLFFNAAVNEPHQKLLLNSLQPLLAYALGLVSIEEAYTDCSKALTSLVKHHAYFTRRVALYSLAEATRQGHPIARMLLLHALYSLTPIQGGAWRVLTPKAETSVLAPWENFSPENITFFKRGNVLVCAGLCDAQEQLKQFFLSLPGYEAFTDLYSIDFKKRDKLEAKVAQGLVRYETFLGDNLIGHKKLENCTYEEIRQLLEFYRKAAQAGDPKAAKDFYLFSSTAAAKYHREKEKADYFRSERPKMRLWASWLGRLVYDGNNVFPSLTSYNTPVPLHGEETLRHIQVFLRKPKMKPIWSAL